MSERTLLLSRLRGAALERLLKSLGEGSRHTALLARLGQARPAPRGHCRWFATPRRLAVRVEDVAEERPDREREALGPPLAQARDEEGNWSRAAQGFAARCGCDAR
jgi:glycyl-tRNA synthetase beta chain